MLYNLCLEKDYTLDEDTYGEDGPYSGFTEETWSNHNFYLSLDKKDYNFEQEIDLNPSIDNYILYVVYGDGGTFGRTNGNTKIILISSKKELLSKIAKTIKDGTYEPEGKYKYIEWEGHFTSLQDIIIQKLETSFSHKESFL